MPFAYITDGATTVPINTGQWYPTSNITWTGATTTSSIMTLHNVVGYIDVVQMDGTRWRIPEAILEPEPERLTAEQQADRTRRQQEARERGETREQQQREANEAAKRLLLSLLSPENQRRLEARTTIRITGSHGGRYEIETTGGATGNIIRHAAGVDSPRIPLAYRGRLCCHPRLRLPEGDLPHYDAIAAQVLMVQSDEPGFLSLANIYH